MVYTIPKQFILFPFITLQHLALQHFPPEHAFPLGNPESLKNNIR